MYEKMIRYTSFLSNIVHYIVIQIFNLLYYRIIGAALGMLYHPLQHCCIGTVTAFSHCDK